MLLRWILRLAILFGGFAIHPILGVLLVVSLYFYLLDKAKRTPDYYALNRPWWFPLLF